MAHENPLWGAPRIHGELLKLGVQVSQATVAKYIGAPATPPSQSWRTFLANHVQQIVAADFFVVPTATYRLLFVLVILAHDRRRIVHVAVTPHPTAAWTAQQLREAFPWDQAPRYPPSRPGSGVSGVSSATAKAMGIEEVRTAPRSPWQNAYVERFIGSVRRECLDHVIVLNAAGLRTILKSYMAYYTHSRTHLSLDKDTPVATGPLARRWACHRHTRIGRTPSPVRAPRSIADFPRRPSCRNLVQRRRRLVSACPPWNAYAVTAASGRLLRYRANTIP